MVASVVGVGLSLFQAITQLQEQTLSFGVKLIVVSITMFICAPWITSELLNFAQDIFGNAHLF
jgi:type III secretion protein S